MKALIIGAGQGKRLLPLTETTPKALLNIGGKSLVHWQIEGFVEGGVREFVFLSGFNTAFVEDSLAALAPQYPECSFRTSFNPFYAVADNLATCWMARGEMTGDFVLVNGDTLFSPPVFRKLLDSPPAPITLAVDHKPHYDEDDMKVQLDGTRLLDIGKKLPLDRVQAESIGMLYFRGDGPRHFVATLEAAMRDQAAIRQWYLSIIAKLAQEIDVQTASVSGLGWCEVDYPLDLERARQMVQFWRQDAAAGPRPSASAT